MDVFSWMNDEGRPLGADLQELASNQVVLLYPKDMVVSND